MEGSSHSSMNESLVSSTGGAASSREESGWTEYLEDFMASEEREATRNCSSCAQSAPGGGSSLVSDAASCVNPWKVSSPSCILEVSRGCKKLKRRMRLDDDSLEDTASSPVSSPKVNDLNKFDVNPKKKDDMRDVCQEKDLAAGKLSETRRDEVNELDFGPGRASDCVELKKNELCLFPMSMLVDFLG